MIDDSLFDAYKKTNYKVFQPELVIRIGKTNSCLNELLETSGDVVWAYITAFNPYSKVLSNEENKIRQNDLLTDVSNYKTHIGHGVDEKEEWPAEDSVLILGITEADAVKLGDKYEQNAIVLGTIYKKAILKGLL